MYKRVSEYLFEFGLYCSTILTYIIFKIIFLMHEELKPSTPLEGLRGVYGKTSTSRIPWTKKDQS